MKTCKWLYDDMIDVYNSDCGQAYSFEASSDLEENHYRYCPWCGRQIETLKEAEDEKE
jgi:hypothetical protein